MLYKWIIAYKVVSKIINLLWRWKPRWLGDKKSPHTSWGPFFPTVPLRPSTFHLWVRVFFTCYPCTISTAITFDQIFCSHLHTVKKLIVWPVSHVLPVRVFYAAIIAPLAVSLFHHDSVTSNTCNTSSATDVHIWLLSRQYSMTQNKATMANNVRQSIPLYFHLLQCFVAFGGPFGEEIW